MEYTLKTKPNGGTIFLPGAGCRWNGEFISVGSYGDYWSSTPHDEGYAFALNFHSTRAYWLIGGRGYEQSVRPVR